MAKQAPWKNKKSPAPKAAPPPSADSPVLNRPGEIPPPLPPLSAASPDFGPAEPGGGTAAATFDDTKLKAGLGKTFCSTTQGIANLLNLMLSRTGLVVEFEPVEPEQGELWAEFALPVLKLWFPK